MKLLVTNSELEEQEMTEQELMAKYPEITHSDVDYFKWMEIGMGEVFNSEYCGSWPHGEINVKKLSR